MYPLIGHRDVSFCALRYASHMSPAGGRATWPQSEL